MISKAPSKMLFIALIVLTVCTVEAKNILRIPKRGENSVPKPELVPKPNPKPEPQVKPEPEPQPQTEPQPEPEPEPERETEPTLFNEKHLLTILYEALCPDSERFMAQLGPAYESLKDFLQLEFVPFGLTKLSCKELINGKCQNPTFTCKHGPTACHANRQHDCALHYSESQEKQLNFIMCAMGENRAPVEKCLTLLGFSSYDFDMCMTFEEGTELQLKSYENTLNWSPEKLPLILLDNMYFAEYQEAATEDFRVFICNILLNKYRNFDEMNAPTICRTNDVFPNLSN